METPGSLLERLRQPADAAAWERFVQLYTPLVFRWLANHNCPKDEIADLMQEVFMTLVQVLPNFTYDRQRSFRRWLRTVTVNKWKDRLKKRSLPLANCPDDWANHVADDDDDPFWETEYRVQLARRALEIMRNDFSGTTWLACWQVVAEGKAVSEVAVALGMTEGAVRAAKFRVLDRLRHELAGLLD